MKRNTGSTGTTVVLVNAASEEQAGLIANALVSGRLAACVNIVSPIRSIYRWKGAIQNETEQMMVIKTRANLVSKIEARVKELHSYEVPEIIAIPIVAGEKSYLDWLLDSTTAKPGAVRAPRVLRRRGRK
jgi:periplasmic divalent cation tolerance protein